MRTQIAQSGIPNSDNLKPHQKSVAAAAAAGMNIVVPAATGSGKTLGYVCASLLRLKAATADTPETVTILAAPFTNLAKNMVADLRKLGVCACLFVGDEAMDTSAGGLDCEITNPTGPMAIVTTPESAEGVSSAKITNPIGPMIVVTTPESAVTVARRYAPGSGVIATVVLDEAHTHRTGEECSISFRDKFMVSGKALRALCPGAVFIAGSGTLRQDEASMDALVELLGMDCGRVARVTGPLQRQDITYTAALAQTDRVTQVVRLLEAWGVCDGGAWVRSSEEQGE